MPLASPRIEPEVFERRPRSGEPARRTNREGILWIVTAGIMLFIGVLKGINLVIVFGYLLFGLWLCNWILARRALRGLAARRFPRPPILAGVPAEWTLEIRRNGPALGSWVLEERIGEATASWLFVRGAADMTSLPRLRVTFPKRGRYRIEPLVAQSSFPFGLLYKSLPLLPADEVIVLPRPARVDGDRLRAWLFNAWAGRDEERRKIRRVVEREAEVHGLRDYRPGDSPRRVHWKATARRNQLTVREYEDSAPPRLLVIVDPWLPKKPSKEDRARLEVAVSLAAGVCKEWRRSAGARLALVIGGATPAAFDGPPGPAVTERLLVALALAEAAEEIDVAPIVRELSRMALAAPVLVLTSRQHSPVPAQVSQLLGRSVAVSYVGRAEDWYKLT